VLALVTALVGRGVAEQLIQQLLARIHLPARLWLLALLLLGFNDLQGDLVWQALLLHDHLLFILDDVPLLLVLVLLLGLLLPLALVLALLLRLLRHDNHAVLGLGAVAAGGLRHDDDAVLGLRAAAPTVLRYHNHALAATLLVSAVGLR
jgi:hypothetical protein